MENIGTRGDYALRKNFTLANIVSKYGVHIQKDTSRQPRTSKYAVVRNDFCEYLHIYIVINILSNRAEIRSYRGNTC